MRKKNTHRTLKRLNPPILPPPPTQHRRSTRLCAVAGRGYEYCSVSTYGPSISTYPNSTCIGSRRCICTDICVQSGVSVCTAIRVRSGVSGLRWRRENRPLMMVERGWEDTRVWVLVTVWTYASLDLRTSGVCVGRRHGVCRCGVDG